uniref:histidine phosphatase family protein n=1 Tax=Paracoccus sp. Ld10 TaxID=649158 RepID=UPI0038668F6E
MRHGQTVWNVQGRLQGRDDSPLTQRGIRQAGWLAELTQAIDGVRVSSPLGRADQTARIVFGSDFGHDQRLSEICVGAFTGRLERDLRGTHPDLFNGDEMAWYDRCPAGEGFHALEIRCRAFLNDIDGPTLVVTHGVTLRMLRCLALQRGVESISDGVVRQGGVHVIRHGAESVMRHAEDT